ncbi:MAG TPA: ABC transporter permease [Actinomycetota bacterium]|nr:ABC transporter permease [Actinomycetota bacterium]
MSQPLPAPELATGRGARLRGTLRNPWRQPRLLAVYSWLFLAWAIIPVAIAVVFSFNAGRSRSTWQGFSLRWYLSDPDLSVLHDPTLHNAVQQSVKLAALTMLIATPIGVAMAIGLARWRGPVASGSNFLMLLPLVTPEIVLASGLLLVFANLYRFGEVTLFGTPAQLFGHVTWAIPYVVVVIRGRLFGFGKEYEEAAMDLGASPTQAMRRVVLPLLAPAIFAAFMIVFALSIDDFVTSQFLYKNEDTITIPMLIYGTGRTGTNPSLNAVATVMLVLSLSAVVIAAVVLRSVARRRGGDGSSATRELVRFEI